MLDLAPMTRVVPQRALHGTPVVDCPRCTLTFVGSGAHQRYADHSWTHVKSDR